MLALVMCLLFAEPPSHFYPIQVEGRIQKPEAFVVVSMPKELAPEAEPPDATRAEKRVFALARAHQTLRSAMANEETIEDPQWLGKLDALVKELEKTPSAGRLEVVRLGLIAWIVYDQGLDTKRAQTPLKKLAKLTKTGLLAQWTRMQLGEEALVRKSNAKEAERWYREAIAVDPQSAMVPFLDERLAGLRAPEK